MLRIQQTDTGYTAQATPPDSSEPWETPAPMAREELRRKLVDLGCHPNEVVHHLDVSDPNWEPPVPAAHWPETARRRREQMRPITPGEDGPGQPQS